MELDLTITQLAYGGDGLGRADGKVVFVPFTAPGDRVIVQVVKQTAGYLRAEVVEILECAAGRVSPPCPVFTRCGGCRLQHVAYPEQLRLVSAATNEMIRRTYGGVPPWVPVSGPAYGYRNRVQLHRADGGLGYRGRGSSAVVRITSCPIAAEEVNALISAGGPIPRDRFTVVGVHGQVAVEGRDREFSVRIGARQFRAPTSSFFQSNFAMLPALAEWVQERLAGDSLLDLYCGVGLWTQLGAERGMRVTGVDSDAAAVRSARGNVQWPGTCFVCAAVERWVGDVACPVSFHSIVVDPPRTGLPKRVRRWLAASGARRIIYVSCNPSTMARDLTDLAPRDGVYRVVETGFFDFYPQTGHVEMAVLLERGVSGPPSS